MLKKGLDKRAAAEQKISSVMEFIDNSIEDVQRICSELRPRVLDHLGLKAAIEWQANKFTEWGGINCFLDLPHDQISLPSSVATSIFRIFQEALTNIARHARAKQVGIESLVKEEQLSLTVQDDGVGFDPAAISSGHYGILGIQERVRLVNGSFELKSEPVTGTILTIHIPLFPLLSGEG